MEEGQIWVHQSWRCQFKVQVSSDNHWTPGPPRWSGCCCLCVNNKQLRGPWASTRWKRPPMCPHRGWYHLKAVELVSCWNLQLQQLMRTLVKTLGYYVEGMVTMDTTLFAYPLAFSLMLAISPAKQQGKLKPPRPLSGLLWLLVPLQTYFPTMPVFLWYYILVKTWWMPTWSLLQLLHLITWKDIHLH